MGIKIENNLASQATSISNDFIDHYMADAHGDYIKVFLYFERHRNEPFDVKDVADALNLTDNDVERAVRYWESKGVFREGSVETVKEEIRVSRAMDQAEEEEQAQESDEPLEPSRYILPKGAVKTGRSAVYAGTASLRAENQEETADGCIGGGKTDSRKLPVNTHASGALDDLRDNEEFGQLVFNLEQYAGIATPQQIGVLEYFYGDLKMSFDLLDYLIEFCAQGGKLTNRYMESVGVNWYEQGIRTPEDAKALVQSFSDPRTKKPKKSGGVSQGRPNKFLNVGKTSMDYEKLAEQEEMDKVLHGFD